MWSARLSPQPVPPPMELAGAIIEKDVCMDGSVYAFPSPSGHTSKEH